MASTSKTGIKINNLLQPRNIIKNINDNNTFEIINKSTELNVNGLSLIDTSNDNLKLILLDSTLGSIKECILYNGNNNCYIHTNIGGYILNTYNKNLKLIFTNDGWKPLSNNTISIPLSERIKLTTKNLIGKTCAFGSSLAFSGDNHTLVVGSSGDNVLKSSIGSVFVFVYNKGNWIEQAKLVSNDTLNFMSAQGYSVAITDDGNTIAVGAPTDGLLIGAVWIYKRFYDIIDNKYSNKAFWKNIQKIKPNDIISNSFFGCSLSFNSDGNLLAIGGDKDNNSGAVWIYKKCIINDTDSYANLQKIVVADNKNIGSYVCLNKYGNKLIFSGNNNIYIYNLINNIFEYNMNLYDSTPNFPTSLTINNDAEIIIAGNSDDEEHKGSVNIYNFDNTEYTMQKLLINDNIGKSKFGCSVATNAKGDLLAIGGNEDNNNIGAVWIFIKNNNKYIQFNKYICSETIKNLSGYIASGSSVYLNDAGNMLFISNLTDNGVGSVSVFN
jgi:hypothetical protein